MENHSKYVEQIYNYDNHGLFVNLFIPSQLNWKQKKVIITQQTEFPEKEKIKLLVNVKNTTSFSLRIRKPFWTTASPIIYVNGKSVHTEIDQFGYLFTKRQWNNGDVVTVDFPMHLYSEAMPDNPNRIAVKYGPLVLAGELGKQMPDPVYGTPVLLTDDKNVNHWIKAAASPLQFEMKGTGKPFDVKLVPFYKVYNQYYSVYWDYFTPTGWEARKAEYEAEKRRQKEIEERTIDNFRMDEMQPERDHNLIASEQSYVSDALGRNGREARRGNYFSFEMKVLSGVKNNLLLTYIGDDKDRVFNILIDGAKLTKVEWKGGITGKFYDEVYPMPDELISGKSKITIRIEANYGKTAGRIFGARIIK
jgi:hypothetical protein